MKPRCAYSIPVTPMGGGRGLKQRETYSQSQNVEFAVSSPSAGIANIEKTQSSHMSHTRVMGLCLV